MKHTAVVLASALLAALEPERADAAMSVRSCTGGTVNLKAIEKRMLNLHNRADRGLKRLCVHPKLQIRNSWMSSKPHRANILDRRFREVGVGAHRGNFKGYDNATMWTVDFGRRR